jgi:predicted HTH transcriptional regulator
MPICDPCALLDRLLRESTESEWLEFKLNQGDPNEIGEYISALANAAMLADKDRAFMIFGVRDGSREKVGTTVRLKKLKKGSENLDNWIARLIEPRLMIDYLDFECDGAAFAIIAIEPTYQRPVRFSGTEYIRIGENKKKLSEFPEHERALWLATGRRKFENAIALTNQTPDQILEKLDTEVFYSLSGEPRPSNSSEILRKMQSVIVVNDNLQARWDITNLGAILLARDITAFPSVLTKSVRIIKYSGQTKEKAEFEQEGGRGYAAGFAGMMNFIMERIPREEEYKNGIRRMVPHYPETAIREILANALIHQDFTLTGSGPVVEIYSDRLEVTNPGNSLIAPDRMIDERRSRNEKLASLMRDLGLCEERGGGLDKALIAIEAANLPAPEFYSSQNSMRVVLFGPRPFSKMTKQDKQRACFYHCVIRWLQHDYMSNSTLRERFSLAPEEYQAVSGVISEAVKAKRIAPADPNQGKKNARYVPYWAA